jgi:glycosyltransferase involved in cell wall biosynthesis
MKIFLPFKVKDIGGPSSFARKFRDGMAAAGHEVIFEYVSDYDVLFLIVQCPLNYLLDAKKKGKKIVQRLDGTYYWSVAGWKFPLMNAKATYIRHFFTDFTVYQSEYSRDCANRFLGKKSLDKYAIIYNGVDLDLFSPHGKKTITRDNPTQKIFFTASAFRRKDQMVPLVEGVKLYRKKYDRNVKLYIAGNFVGEVGDFPQTLKKLKFITLLGKINNSELPSYERSADVFLFTHLNPPCPNNIIESLSCGLPICGVADGAMPELVQNSQNGLLIPAPGTGFWRIRRYNTSQFADNMAQIIKNNHHFRQQSRKTAEEDYALNKMINQYVKVFGGFPI